MTDKRASNPYPDRCPQRDEHGRLCTRPRGHDGDHDAGGLCNEVSPDGGGYQCSRLLGHGGDCIARGTVDREIRRWSKAERKRSSEAWPKVTCSFCGHKGRFGTCPECAHPVPTAEQRTNEAPPDAKDLAIAKAWADEPCRPGKDRLEDAGCVEALAQLIGRIRAEERAARCTQEAKPDAPHMVDERVFLDEVRRATLAESEVARLRTALTKLNEIRNSIVGVQGFNFSEHAYPMVAALNEAGFEGLPYPEARANVGTLIERATKAEAELEALRARCSDKALPDPLDVLIAGMKPTEMAKSLAKAVRRGDDAEIEAERLRGVIKTGGAMYRAERARLGVPGGHEPAPDLDYVTCVRCGGKPPEAALVTVGDSSERGFHFVCEVENFCAERREVKL